MQTQRRKRKKNVLNSRPWGRIEREKKRGRGGWFTSSWYEGLMRTRGVVQYVCTYVSPYSTAKSALAFFPSHQGSARAASTPRLGLEAFLSTQAFASARRPRDIFHPKKVKKTWLGGKQSWCLPMNICIICRLKTRESNLVDWHHKFLFWICCPSKVRLYHT